MLFLFVLLVNIFHPGAIVCEDFCQWETFNASCHHDEFILITSARYGRMNVGRCLPVDFYTSCSLDVIHQLEARCSGRQRCVVSVADRDLFKVQPCRKDLHAYLEASYKCVKIAGAEKLLPSLGVETTSFGLLQCEGPVEIEQSDGYLSRSFTMESGLGGENCPWYLEVRTGQRLKFTLVNFQTVSHHQQPINNVDKEGVSYFEGEGCASVVFVEVRSDLKHHPSLKQHPPGLSIHPHGLSIHPPNLPTHTQGSPTVHSMKNDEDKARKILEKWKNRTRSDSKVHFVGICPGRQSSSLVSNGNKVFAYWMTNKSIIDHSSSDVMEAPIFLKFEVLGCPEVIPPINTWSVRTGDVLLVTCNATDEKWQFQCEGGLWKGQQVNCSLAKNEDKALQNADLREVRSLPLGLMLAISVGVVIGIAIGFLFLLLVCLCRRKVCKRRYNNVKVADHEENIYKLIDFHSIPLPPPSSTHSLTTQVRASNLNLLSSTTPSPFADVIPHPLPDLQLTSGSCVTSLCSSSHVTPSWIEPDPSADNTLAGSRGGCVSLGRSSGSGLKKFAGEGSTWTLARPGSKISLFVPQKKSFINDSETCQHHSHQPCQQQQLKTKHAQQPQCHIVCNYQRRGSQQTCKKCLDCSEVQWKQMEILN